MSVPGVMIRTFGDFDDSHFAFCGLYSSERRHYSMTVASEKSSCPHALECALAGWSAGLLVGWLVEWLVDWLVDWLSSAVSCTRSI